MTNVSILQWIAAEQSDSLFTMWTLIPVIVGLAQAESPSLETPADPRSAPAALAAWNAEEEAALERGEPIFQTWRDLEGRQWGVSRVRVDASKPSLWELILNVDDYVRFLPYVTASSVETREEDGECEAINARFSITTLRVTTQYRQTLRYCATQDTAIFWFKQGGLNAIEGAAGWWRVIETDDQLELEYAIAVETYWWLPKRMEEKAAKLGLPRIVREIKDEAEDR
jgi:ribosome-associated toxin RatA of RatAB toxin-antitoxin module